MSARAMASATVSFGLVSIPVKLYSSSETSSSLSLNWVHKKCGGRVKQQYYCPTDDEVVASEEMVKGYEFAKGQFVLFSDEELKNIMAKATQTIEIIEFLPAEKVDPIYFEKAYYIGPNKGGDRPYRLLAEAMKETSRWAIAKYGARGKQYVVLLRPFEQGLVMQQLRYADELKAFSEVPIGDSEVKDTELQLARQLIDQIAVDTFKPGEYNDEVKARLLEMIESKIEGKDVTAAPAAEPKAQIIDLMEALKASLGEQGSEPSESKRKPPKRSVRKETVTSKTASGAKG